ncbi:MAG: hypothetical protein EB162_04825, partial [Euryarchaeota archaeon]|nr:hypothetical protein [Euryarchaeota archaeon]
MKKVSVALVLLFFVPILAGCVSSVDDSGIDRDSRIDGLEESQRELTILLAEQEQKNSDLLASISQ